MRGRFHRRVGCLFALFMLFIGFMCVLAVGLVLRFIAASLPSEDMLGWAILGGVVLLVFGLGVLYWAGSRMRRLTMPFGDLLEASERLSTGDYTARVNERGLPEMRSLGRAFNLMAERLQVHDEQRKNLLADVTHELRTPLTVIQGNVEGMLDGVYPVDENHLKAVLEETRILSRLVDDLRTLALAESGSLHLIKEPTDPGVLIGETVAGFRLQARTSGVSLDVQIQSDIDLIEIDPERMHQVLSNLIANALRYTPEGGAIRVRYEQPRIDGNDLGIIEVEDDGPGIPPEDLPHVFERFYKTRDSGGMGLGLSIAKDLVEAHDGSIQVESHVGEGTLIRITLPIL